MSGYRHRGEQLLSAPSRPETAERHARSAASLSVFAAVASLLLLSVAAVPHASSLELDGDDGVPDIALSAQELQGFEVADSAQPSAAESSSYGATEAHLLSVPTVGVPDPGTAQAIAYELVFEQGWDDQEFACLVALWDRESHWNVYSHNPSSGAYGIPQALPGEKMASAGDDWRTNPRTQIIWGIGYIAARYGTPCAAWESSETRGWY